MDTFAAFFRDVGLSFIPLFIAVDPIGVLPFVITLTQEMSTKERPRVIRYAILTAFALGLGFTIIGQVIFLILGITISDFLVAGGLLLLILSIRHLLTGKIVELQSTISGHMLGVVPLGTPLVVGPAVLTTLLLLIQQHQVAAVVLSFALNLAVAWLILAQANRVARWLREPGLRTTSQIANLLLAAIAVMMIRKGILQLLT